MKVTKYSLLTSIAHAVLTLDQWTKHLVLKSLELHESITVIPGFFQLTYVRNPGVAFGFLATTPAEFRTVFLTAFPIVAVGFILYLYRNLEPSNRYPQIAYSLIAGGALGNLWDRLQLGYVVDSLDFHWNYAYHFPSI